MYLLGIVAIIFVIIQAIKEACEKPVPAENWANKKLYYKDINDGVPMKQVMKNLENGKYKLTETYPEPHRDPSTGKVIIENCELFDEDLEKYGAVQTYKWVDQGKYNLEGEALEAERKRIKEHYDRCIYTADCDIEVNAKEFFEDEITLENVTTLFNERLAGEIFPQLFL